MSFKFLQNMFSNLANWDQNSSRRISMQEHQIHINWNIAIVGLFYQIFKYLKKQQWAKAYDVRRKIEKKINVIYLGFHK